MSRVCNPAAVPITEFVAKVASWCNLACDYCYVYTMADQTWRTRPAVIAPETIQVVAHRIGEHAITHQLPSVRVIMHGGEPLLAGHAVLEQMIIAIKRALPEYTKLDLRLQTNGVLLDTEYLRLFSAHSVAVCVSLDGTAEQHDSHRPNAAGRGTYDLASRAIHLLSQSEYRELYAGILCVVDTKYDPILTYESLLKLEPPAIDFLLPHGNWTSPPPGREPTDPATPYADWLIAVFDRWYSAEHQEMGVRFFQEINNLILGGRSHTERIGAGPVAYLVIDTDGSYQQDDSLKSTRPGGPETGMSIFSATVDEVADHPAVRARQAGIEALSAECKRCPIVRVCGGGDYTHRYRAGHGFQQPSVYCPDLRRLIQHIVRRVRHDIAASVST